MPWLGAKGNKEKIRRLRKIAENIGLEIKLYTEDERVDVTFTVPSNSAKIESILKLPPELIKTYSALKELKEGLASDVAELTGRARAYESHNLKRLYEEGHITVRKDGRRKYYGITD